MKRGGDDEALSWGDENDPTYVAPELDDVDAEPGEQVDAAGPPRWASTAAPAEATVAANSSAVADARTVQAEAAEDASVEDELASAEAAMQQLSSPALIAFGILGGVYFLFTIGWFVSLLRSVPDSSSLAGIVQIVLTVLAVAAPVLWFAATLFIAYRRRVAVRLAWLLVGVLVLIPWPFITGR